MTTTEDKTDPAYTATTEEDLLAKAVKLVTAYRLVCKYCQRHTPICEDVPAVVKKARELGMMVVDIDNNNILSGFGGGQPDITIVCADCAKRPLASFRFDDKKDPEK